MNMKKFPINNQEIIHFDQEVSQSQSVNSSTLIKEPSITQINSINAYIKNQNTLKTKTNNLSLTQQINKSEIISDSISELSMDRSEIVFRKNLMGNKILKNQENNLQEIEFHEQDQSPQKISLQNKYKRKQKQSLMLPPQNLYKKVYLKLNKTYQSLSRFNFSQLHDFLHSSLSSIQETQYMRYVFEIHHFNFQFTFHSYYEFYLRNSQGQMINILRAEKQSLTVSSAFQIYAIHQKKLQTKQFTSKLKYNTLKTEYNLYDIDQKIHKELPRNILATVLYDKSFGQNRKLQLFKPKDQYRIKGEFVRSPNLRNLSQIYDESESIFSRKIQKLKTEQIQESKQQFVREQFELKKQGRKILLSDELQNQKIYMGKKQDGRYIILCGTGLSPLQIFMLAIVNLQH